MCGSCYIKIFGEEFIKGIGVQKADYLCPICGEDNSIDMLVLGEIQNTNGCAGESHCNGHKGCQGCKETNLCTASI